MSRSINSDDPVGKLISKNLTAKVTVDKRIDLRRPVEQDGGRPLNSWKNFVQAHIVLNERNQSPD
jgi:hypothetical protein